VGRAGLGSPWWLLAALLGEVLPGWNPGAYADTTTALNNSTETTLCPQTRAEQASLGRCLGPEPGRPTGHTP